MAPSADRSTAALGAWRHAESALNNLRGLVALTGAWNAPPNDSQVEEFNRMRRALIHDADKLIDELTPLLPEFQKTAVHAGKLASAGFRIGLNAIELIADLANDAVAFFGRIFGRATADDFTVHAFLSDNSDNYEIVRDHFESPGNADLIRLENLAREQALGTFDRLNREQTASDASAPSLGERAQLVLKVLLNAKAFDSDHRMPTADIAQKAAGRGTDAGQYKEVITELKGLQYVETREGRGGGCWLTALGCSRAEKL